MHVGYVLKKFPRTSETFILNEILEHQRQGTRVSTFSLYPCEEGVFHPGLAELREPVRYLLGTKSSPLVDFFADRSPTLSSMLPRLGEVLQELLASRDPEAWRLLRWGSQLALWVTELGIDRLHAHFATSAARTAWVASRLAGVPFGMTCHAKDLYHQDLDAAWFRRLCHTADPVVTVCDSNARYIQEEILGGPVPTLRRIYNGVDLERFHPRERQTLDPPLILGIGRLVEKKGWPLLIEAVGELARRGNGFRCVLIGDGALRQELESRAQELAPDCIELWGALPQDRVREALARATMLVLPCIIGTDGNRDALPTVLLEALATGIPVITTPIVGNEEIVGEDEAGRLVPAGDVPALVDAVESLLRAPEERARLGAAGRARAERLFDLRHNVAELRAAFSGKAAESISR